MIISRKNKIVAVLILILTLIWTGFIFSMSLKTASESSEISGGLLKTILLFVKDILWFDVEFSTLHSLFRKLAHFTEFFILGTFSGNFFFIIKKKLYFPLVYCLLTAITDEILQFFTGAGRSAQLSDVVLDFFGSLTAVIIIWLLYRLFSKLRIKG